MAARGQELNTRITATNEASAVFNQAGADAQRLEGTLDRLTAEERKIVLEAEASKLEREVDRAYKSLATLRDQDQIDIVIDAKDQAKAKLAAVREQIDRLDAEQAVVDVDADTTKARSAVDDLGDLIETKLGGSLGSVADLMTGKGGIAAGAGLLVGGLAAAADKAADLAIEAANLSTLTGDTVERSSALAGVFRQAGIEGKDLQDIVLQMNGALTQSPELAGRLGVDLADGATAGERFVEVVDRLGTGFEDAGTRSQVASQLFGEEGVRQVNAVRNAFGELGQAVDDYTGKIFTAADAQEAFRVKQQIAEYRQEWEDFTVDAGQLALDVAEKTKNAFLVPARFMESLAGGYNAFDTSATTAAIEDSERAAQAFDRSILASFDSASQVHDAVLAITGDLHAANIITAEWANTNKAVADTMTTSVSPAATIIANEIAAAALEFERFGSDGVEQMGAVEEAIVDVETALDRLKEEVDDRDSWRDLKDSFDDVHGAAVEAWNATAEGAENADAKVRNHQGSVDDLRVRVWEYGQDVLGLPESKLTEIDAKIRDGAIEEVETELDTLTEEREVVLAFRQTGLDAILGAVAGAASAINRQGGSGNGSTRRHVGGTIGAGERVRVLSGEEIEFTAPAAGRVFSREDVARTGAPAPSPVTVEPNITLNATVHVHPVVVNDQVHWVDTGHEIALGLQDYVLSERFVDNITAQIAFRLEGTR